MQYKPPDWIHDAVFYQIFPDRFYNGDHSNDPPNVTPWGKLPKRENFFGGDLLGIIKKLDCLEDLDINCLYLTPIFKAPSNHKYDTVNYYEVDPCFGDMATLKSLVEEVHRRGMKIILDGVFNHCGFEHPFFQDAVKNGPKSKYWNWFMIDRFPITQQPEPNYHCFAGTPAMPEFNTKNPAVREYLLDIVQYWIMEADIDGWRLDVVEFMDASFVKQIYQTSKSVKEDAYVMGEVLDNAASWFKGNCLDAVMNYKLRDYLDAFFVKDKFNAIEFDSKLYTLRRSYLPWSNYAMYNLLGSHDRPRVTTLCHGDMRRIKLALTFLFTYVGVPAIYYGDEIGLEGGVDPDCRRPMIWDKNQQNINLLNFYKRMIKLRRESRALRRGNFKSLYQHDNLYCFSRQLNEEKIIIALNNSVKNQEINIPLPEIKTRKRLKIKDIFDSTENHFVMKQNELNLKISAYDFKILSITPFPK